MFTIDFYFHPSTIQRENDRHPETLTADELINWTFAARISFGNSDLAGKRLVLQDAAFFQILEALWIARDQAQRNENISVRTTDREGGYRLTINSTGDTVELGEQFAGYQIRTNLSEFLQAVGDFSRKALQEIPFLFPELSSNPNYLKLIQKAEM